MRLETIPVILGILFAVAGLALVADAAVPDGALARAERRRGPRPQRHLKGEAALGIGIVSVGIGLIGGDGWRYTTLAFLAAFILCGVGVVLNWRYVRGMMLVKTGQEADAPDRTMPERTTPDREVPLPGQEVPAAAGPPNAAPPNAAAPDDARRSERRLHAR